MNFIVLQHIKIEDPGYIKDLMLADGFKLTTIELDEGEKIPDDLSKFDGMFCMGGPMDTYMEDQYPRILIFHVCIHWSTHTKHSIKFT